MSSFRRIVEALGCQFTFVLSFSFHYSILGGGFDQKEVNGFFMGGGGKKAKTFILLLGMRCVGL